MKNKKILKIHLERFEKIIKIVRGKREEGKTATQKKEYQTMKLETAVTITDPDEMRMTISYPGRTEACWMSPRSKKLVGIFFAEYAFFDLQKSFVDNRLQSFIDDLKSCARRIMNVYPPTEGKPYQLIQKLARQYKKALIQIADERKAKAPKRDWI